MNIIIKIVVAPMLMLAVVAIAIPAGIGAVYTPPISLSPSVTVPPDFSPDDIKKQQITAAKPMQTFLQNLLAYVNPVTGSLKPPTLQPAYHTKKDTITYYGQPGKQR